MTELKPCPFCGRVPKIEYCENWGYFIICKCGIEQSELYKQKRDAVRHWNRRKVCKHYGDKQICGRCRSRNLFCEAEPQPRCPKCGKRGYIRSLESMGVKLKVFDEYKWKCTNCNKYFKEEPKDEPQTERSNNADHIE